MAQQVVQIVKNEHFERLLSTNSEMRRKMRRNVRKVLTKAKSDVSRTAKSVLTRDPRAAYKAVRRTVYKRMLGGNITILRKRRAGNVRVSVVHERKSGRGGNRRPRSPETERINSYYGADRGFILTFVNQGTQNRVTRYGRRGRITAKPWFSSSSRSAVNNAARDFVMLADNDIQRTKV